MGTTTVGIFSAVGRETKGALRSVGYDLRHSKRFRTVSALAVAGVAGGVLVAGTVLRGPVPEMLGVGSDQGESGVTDGWWGFGSDTQSQDAEADGEPSGGPAGEEGPRTGEDRTSGPPEDDDRTGPGGFEPSNPPPPGLEPVAPDEGVTPSEEHSPTEPGEVDPTPSWPQPGPGDEPTEDPSDLPPHVDPTPSHEPSPSGTADSPGQAPRSDSARG